MSDEDIDVLLWVIDASIAYKLQKPSSLIFIVLDVDLSVKVKLPSAKPVNNAQRNEFEDLLALNLNKLNEYNLPKYE